MLRHQGMMTASAHLSLLACLTLTAGLTLGLGSNQDVEFTFLLPAGSTECFYQTAAVNDSMKVEYQGDKKSTAAVEDICQKLLRQGEEVIAGSGLDVGFALISPSGYRLVSDFRRSDGIHMVDPTEDGDYLLCFDNSFSKVSQKMVFFEVIINSQASAGGGRDEWADIAMTESMVEYKLEDIRASMDSVYQHLEKTRQVQATLRAFEARDRYLLESNLWRVSFWSCLNLLVMLLVAVTQIYTLRRLFDDTKRVRT